MSNRDCTFECHYDHSDGDEYAAAPDNCNDDN